MGRCDREAISTVPSSHASKWKDSRYSRASRNKRKLLSTVDPFQPDIDSVFPILNELELLLQTNDKLKSELTNSIINNNKITSDSFTLDTKNNLTTFMKDLLVMSHKNSTKKDKGKRYDENIKSFSSYIFVLAGRGLYECLRQNLSLPSVATVLNHISREKTTVKEGYLRIEELLTFIKDRNLSKNIWLSEDQTRVTSKVEYDSKTNQLVGFVLPLSSDTGMPILSSFPANNASDIVNSFNSSEISSLVNVIIAHPIEDGAPTFCLCLYGTSNRFTTADVLKRWKFIVEQLEINGLHVLGIIFHYAIVYFLTDFYFFTGISSDGDSRLLRSMRITSKLPSQSEIPYDLDNLFYADLNVDLKCVQDTVHIGTKFRTRLLNEKQLIVMGDHMVHPEHLRILIRTVSKDQHLLVSSDISASDKMNFKSVRKITDLKVSENLKIHVPKSNATIKFLELMKFSIDCFLDKELTPLQRIYKLWYTVFFLRLWKMHLIESKEYSLKNFITYNLYACIELNAHSLVSLLIHFRENDDSDSFLPWMFSSQSCESFFRCMRSMTSTFSTVVNFNVLEILHRLKRIDIQGDVACNLGKKGYEFKSNHNGYISSGKLGKTYTIPSNEDIFEEIKNAKFDAIKDCELFGIFPENNLIPIQLTAIKLNEFEGNAFEDETFEENEEEVNSEEDDTETEETQSDDEIPDGLDVDYALINFSTLNIQNYKESKY